MKIISSLLIFMIIFNFISPTSLPIEYQTDFKDSSNGSMKVLGEVGGLYCKPDEIMQGFQLTEKNDGGSKLGYNYLCTKTVAFVSKSTQSESNFHTEWRKFPLKGTDNNIDKLKKLEVMCPHNRGLIKLHLHVIKNEMKYAYTCREVKVKNCVENVETEAVPGSDANGKASTFTLTQLGIKLKENEMLRGFKMKVGYSSQGKDTLTNKELKKVEKISYVYSYCTLDDSTLNPAQNQSPAEAPKVSEEDKLKGLTDEQKKEMLDKSGELVISKERQAKLEEKKKTQPDAVQEQTVPVQLYETKQVPKDNSQELKNIQIQHEEALKRIQEEQKNHKDTAQKLAIKEKEIASLKDQIKTLQEANKSKKLSDEARKDSEAKIQGQLAENTKLNNEINKMKNQLKSLQEMNIKLQQEKNLLEQQNKKLTGDNQNLKSSKLEVERNNQQIKGEKENKEKALEEMKSKKNKLKEQNKKLEAERQELEKQRLALLNEKEKLENEKKLRERDEKKRKEDEEYNKKSAEAAKKKAEEEKNKIEAERKKLEEEKEKLILMKKQIEDKKNSENKEITNNKSGKEEKEKIIVITEKSPGKTKEKQTSLNAESANAIVIEKPTSNEMKADKEKLIKVISVKTDSKEELDQKLRSSTYPPIYVVKKDDNETNLRKNTGNKVPGVNIIYANPIN